MQASGAAPGAGPRRRPIALTTLVAGREGCRESLPRALQWLGSLLPLTYFVIVLRGILIKGVGIEYLWRQILPLTGLGVLVFFVAIRRFQKRID